MNQPVNRSDLIHPLVIPKNFNLFNEAFHLPDLSGYPERFPRSAIADNIPDSSLVFVGLSKVTTLAMLQSVDAHAINIAHNVSLIWSCSVTVSFREGKNSTKAKEKS